MCFLYMNNKSWIYVSALDLKNTENQDSPEYSLVTVWSEVITNVISQNILKIAEAVSKEALISSDVISRVMINDGLPLEKAEILFQALKKEIKKDSNMLHKFMAILSTYGSGEDKVLMQTLKNYLSSHSKWKFNAMNNMYLPI